MAYIVIAHIVMAYVNIAYVLMACIVMAYIGMAYMVMAIRLAPTSPSFCNKCDSYFCRCDDAAIASRDATAEAQSIPHDASTMRQHVCSCLNGQMHDA